MKGRKFAISDIHGCAKTFRRLIEEKIVLTEDDRLFLLGDYINRGPDSKGVIDYIFALKALGYKVETLRGNHEEMVLNALEDKKNNNLFLKNGGKSTLSSFNVQNVGEIPKLYLKFFQQTVYYLKIDNYYLVHAGFDFSGKDPLKDKEAMLWIREFKVDKQWLGDHKIIHGHTPLKKKAVLQQLKNTGLKAINIDCGCVYFPRKGSRLCALDLDTLEFHFSKNVEWTKVDFQD